MNRKQEIQIEMNIAMRVVDALLKDGYAIGVFDGEEETVINSTNREEIKEALFTTDDDRLLVYKEGKKIGWVYLVWGNVADVISDYTTNLEHVIGSIIKNINEGRI